jgi:Ni/Fe-hydrogenase 1 B-type cytochrome subunit
MNDLLLRQTREEAEEARMERGEALVRVRVWDRIVRNTHLLIALSIVVLSVTGVLIGHPLLVSTGPAGRSFLMGTVKVVHFYAAIVFTLAVLSRIVWMFVGPGHASWREFFPIDPERRKRLVPTLLFYLFLRRRPPTGLGHNPLAGLSYVVVFGLYLVMVATGLGLYAVDAGAGSPLHAMTFVLPIFDGAQGARWVHHVVMWLLLGFVVHHVYSAVLTAIVERNGTIDSIVTGWKWVPRSIALRDKKERP